MDTPSTLLKPRLRLFRRSPSPRTQGDADATPQAGPSAARSFHDDESDEFPTPRIHPKPIAEPTPRSLYSASVNHTETPAARLRALLAREPRSPRASSPPPAPSSEADSTADPPRFGSSTSSVARDNLKDIFSRALREPGDTPQKGRPRSSSFDGSSMETTPVVGRDRARRRAARRSLSDEEAEKPRTNGRADPSFRLSTALAFDTLRARLASSRSQLMDQHPPEALYDHSSLASTNTSRSRQPQPSASARVNPHVSSLTPHPSFQMSSHLAFQSNLLEQDSEMQRAMGDVLNSESEASAAASNAARPTAVPPDPRPSSSMRESLNGSKLERRRPSYELDLSASNSSVNGANGREHRSHSQQEGPNHQREREWSRPRLPSRSDTPEMLRRHSLEFRRRLSQEFRSPSHSKSFSHESVMSQNGIAKPPHRHLERRDSLASLRSFDDDRSSRPSSIGSQADYRDRISELDREKNYGREREWNRRQPPSRPSSSLSTSSNHSFSHSHPPRSPSAIPYLTPTHASLQRKSSRTSLRSDSPASLASSRELVREREQEEKREITQERERNWNSPRPNWSATKPPSSSHLHSLRASSSLPHLRDSNRRVDASRGSSKLQSALSNASTSAASAADSGLEASADILGTNQSTQLKHSSPGKSPGAASKFGWNFARSPLPPLELDDTADHHKRTSSPAPGSRSPSRPSEVSTSSQIPVRSRMKSFSTVDHAMSDMSLTHVVGEESSFQQDHQRRPGMVVEPHGRGDPPAISNAWSWEETVPGNEEQFLADPSQSTTPRSNPPKPIPEEIETDAETEILMSPSPQGSPQLGTSTSVPSEAPHQNLSDPLRTGTPGPLPEWPPTSATPPGTPPSASLTSQLHTIEVSSSFALVTPPRAMSFGSSVMDFQTPSPPVDLPDLPGPPSSDEDALANSPSKDRRDNANLNLTLTKTPKPPGAWAATPLPSKFGHRPSSPMALFPLESTPPASTSTPLPRANSLPPTRAAAAGNPGEGELLTPVGTLSRGRSLPLRTPAPPGAWVATPGQSTLLGNGVDQSQFGSLGRRKGLLKVRFDVAESETSATEGHPNSPLSAIRLINPELPLPKMTTNASADNDAEPVMNEVTQLASPPAALQRPATPERPTTPISREPRPSPRSLRKSPSVRLVDAYGRERVDEEGTAQSFIDLPNGHVNAGRKTTQSPPTPRHSLVRVVDAMGREVSDTSEIFDALEGRPNRSLEVDLSVVSDDTPIGHAEALVRMRKTLKDLAESLSDSDRSEDFNSSHLEQLEEVSRAARLARNQLAHNLHIETEKQHDLHRDKKSFAWSGRPLPAQTKKSWNTTIIYCGVIIQLLFILVIWRYTHAEARRLFYTRYYDPLYPEFTPIQESSCFSGTLSMSRPYTMLDSYETIRREGWRSIGKEVFRAMRHVGDQAWERWGENVHLEKPT